MKKQNNEEQEDLLDSALKTISPSTDEYIERRIHHRNFSLVIFWLCAKSRTDTCFHADELRKFLKFTSSAVHNILNGLVEIGLLKKVFSSSIDLLFYFIKEDGRPLVVKYFDKAKKTLGIKVQMSFKRDEEIGEETI